MNDVTPGPWYARKIDEKKTNVYTELGLHSLGSFRNYEDAELVVRIRNSHEELVVANKSLMDEIGKQAKEKLALRESHEELLDVAKFMARQTCLHNLGDKCACWPCSARKAIAKAEARP